MNNREPHCKPISANCSELYDRVCETGFYMHDLQLYLDTHPDDEAALEMFKEACKQYEACREAFEACCYPLRSCSAGQNEDSSWDWLCGACVPPVLIVVYPSNPVFIGVRAIRNFSVF